MTKEFIAAYNKIMESLRKYSEFNEIPIRRARYVISYVHRINKPYTTKVIKELSDAGWIKLNGGFGKIELLK